MLIKAAPGLKCPMEGRPRDYISDDPAGVDVPDTSYYQRLLADGSLVLVSSPAKAAEKTKGGDQ